MKYNELIKIANNPDRNTKDTFIQCREPSIYIIQDERFEADFDFHTFYFIREGLVFTGLIIQHGPLDLDFYKTKEATFNWNEVLPCILRDIDNEQLIQFVVDFPIETQVIFEEFNYKYDDTEKYMFRDLPDDE